MDVNLLKSDPAKELCIPTECVVYRQPCGADLIDAKTLLASCGDDPILLNKMIRSFEVYAQNHLSEVEGAIECGDTAELRRVARRLKGLISSFSTTAANAAAILERMAASGTSEGIAQHYLAVSDMIDAISGALADTKIDDLKQRVVVAKEFVGN